MNMRSTTHFCLLNCHFLYRSCAGASHQCYYVYVMPVWTLRCMRQVCKPTLSQEETSRGQCVCRIVYIGRALNSGAFIRLSEMFESFTLVSYMMSHDVITLRCHRCKYHNVPNI